MGSKPIPLQTAPGFSRITQALHQAAASLQNAVPTHPPGCPLQPPIIQAPSPRACLALQLPQPPELLSGTLWHPDMGDYQNPGTVMGVGESLSCDQRSLWEQNHVLVALGPMRAAWCRVRLMTAAKPSTTKPFPVPGLCSKAPDTRLL